MTFHEYQRLPPKDYPPDNEDEPMPQPSVLQSVADSVWLKMVERIAMPVIAIVGWQMWTTLDALKQQQPIIDLRVDRLEDFSKAFEARADSARTERTLQNQNVLVEISGLKKDVGNLANGQTLLLQSVERLNDRINGRENQP